MATAYLKGEGAPVTLPAHYPPMPAVAHILARFNRKQLAGFVTVAVDLIDAMDGDPDEEDATGLEDEGLSPLVRRHAQQFGPGCETSDAGGGNVEDEGEAVNECEVEQALHDVPCLRVYALEPDPVTGERTFLGMSNLSPAFVASVTPASA